ncbi:MAG: D-aminoacyl-tRNA deacylase [Bacilli bacterium]|nr:D-aminoacyl-tRNA deacylase [Bacilli bacterium]
MRILIQECLEASVVIDGIVHSSIGKGELVFVSFTEGDNETTIDKMIDKMLKLRIFEDENGKTNYNLSQHGGTILAVSQFTLYADIRKGNRPSFQYALKGEESEPLFNLFCKKLSEKIEGVQTGVFGADMKVRLINDGPFTVWMDSKELGI